MMFLMSEDNISHIAFQHLEATLTLKVLQNKVGQSSRCPQNTHPKILIPTKKSHDQQKIQYPNKSPPWLTKISMSKQNFSMTNKKIFHDQQEISMSKQNFSMPNKTIFFFFSNPYPQKFPYPWDRTYTFQQNFYTHQKWICSIKPTHQIFNTSLPTKFKSKFIHQYHKLQTLPNFMSHQHCPNFTLPNNLAIQKMP